ncbi:MAG: aarF domain-containing kinase, partial [Myxococcota bacterium]
MLNLIRRAFVTGWIVLRFGIPALFLKARRPEFARRAFEALGPTYIKLGQIIASSPGLFPPAYVDEFQRCLDQVPEFPFSEVERIIAEETKMPVSEAFAEVDPKPIAAASIAQVHAAKLSDGTDVVIKV